MDASLNPGQRLQADLRVGQMLSAAPYPWLGHVVDQAWIDGPGGRTRIDGRDGDLPAIAGSELTTGLHTIVVATRPAYVTFDSLDGFRDYLQYEGRPEIAEAHMARGLAVDAISEEYIRNSRTLIQIGPLDHDATDRPVGLPLEIVVQGSPFESGRTVIEATVRWSGKAEPGASVSLHFKAHGGSSVHREIFKAAGDGSFTIPVLGAGDYLLNSVHLEPVTGPGDVRWRSHWASLFFTLPE